MDAVIYARQSSGKEENSDSIEAQLKACKAYCKEHKLKIIGEFTDANTSGRTYPDNESGRRMAGMDSAFNVWFEESSTQKMFRPGLAGAFACLHDGCRFVVDDFTRICRPVNGSYLWTFIMEVFTRKNISIYCTKTGPINPGSLTDSLFSTLQNSINDQQLAIQKRKSQDVRNKLQNAGTMPMGTKALGFVKIAEHKYKLDKTMLPMIKHVFAETLKLRPYAAIVREANAMYNESCHKNFYTSNFYNMVDNPLYCGYMKDTSGKLIPWNDLVCEPVVSFSDWMKIQDIREVQRKQPTPGRGKNTLIFSALLYCGKCGARLVTSADRGVTSYHCFQGAIVKHDHDCSKSRIGIDIPWGKKDYVGLKQAMAPFLALAQYKLFQESCNIGENRNKLALLEADRMRLKECEATFVDMFTSGKVSRERYENMIANLTPKINRNSQEIAKISASLNTDKILAMMNDSYWGDFESIMNLRIPDEKYKELIRIAIKKIVCFETYIEIFTEWGNFKLDRWPNPKRRHLPKFTYKGN